MILAIFLSVLSSLIGSVGAIYLKMASNKGIFKQINLSKKNKFSEIHKNNIFINNKELIIGFTLYIIGILTFVPALMYGELSILYPIISLSYVWVALISMKVFKEKVSSVKWIGIVLIIIGVSLIAL